VDGLLVTNGECVGLIVRALS